jgi:transposase
MNVAGIDVGKKNLDMYLSGKNYIFSNNTEGIKKILNKCIDSRVILEPSGGYEKKLLRELSKSNIKVSFINPERIRHFAKSIKDIAKTDKIDAKILSLYGEKMEPNLYIQKEEYRYKLEGLTNRRCQIVEYIMEEKNRLEKEPASILIKSIKEHILYLEKEQKDIEVRISDMISSNAAIEDRILQSEKGIGAQTSAILIGQLPELGRLDNRQIAKMVGLAPMNHDSGKYNGNRSIRGGRHKVRQALYMASISALRSNPKVKEFYKRLKDEGKPSKVAIVAVMRKLLVILNAKMRMHYDGKIVY